MAININKIEERQIKDAIERVWQTIGADVMEYAGDNVDNEDAVGACFEHLHSFDEEGVWHVYDSLVCANGFGAVRSHFVSIIRLN